MLIHRASGNSIYDNRIVGNRGGAGVMLTGDDGNGNPTATTTVHNKVQRNEFLDNGDGLELTRGAAFNMVADNVFRSTAANPEPSQGIEILLGNDNVVVSNRFEGYSDGLQINWGHRNYIAANIFTNNTFGLSLSGAGNIIDGNVISGNAVGIAVRPAPTMTMAWISHNAIYGNGQKIERCFAGGSCDPDIRKGGIVFGLPSGEHERYVGKRGTGVAPAPGNLAKICPDGAPNCQAPPNGGLAAPTLERVRKSANELTVQGEPTGEAAVAFHGRSVRQSGGGQRRRRNISRRGRDHVRRRGEWQVLADGRCHQARRDAGLVHGHAHVGGRRHLGVQPTRHAVGVSGGSMFPPERIVCLTEETVETLYLLGEERRIVGVSGYAVRPARVRKEKPRVSAFISADFQKILALEPDLVLTFSDLQADIAAELIRRNVAVHAFNQRDVAGILAMIRTLGALVGAAGKADALAAALERRLARGAQPRRARSRAVRGSISRNGTSR